MARVFHACVSVSESPSTHKPKESTLICGVAFPRTMEESCKFQTVPSAKVSTAFFPPGRISAAFATGTASGTVGFPFIQSSDHPPESETTIATATLQRRILRKRLCRSKRPYA